jgi:hypothetical protein
MKTLWRTVCAAVGLAALAPAAWLGASRSASAVEPLENVLPKDTLVFVSVRNLPQFVEKSKQLPGYKILIEQGFFEKIIPPERFEKARAASERFIKPLETLLDGQVAFALLGTDQEGGLPSMAFLADVEGTEVAFGQYLDQTIYPWLKAGGVKLEELRIGHTLVVRFSLPKRPDGQIFLAVDEGVFAAATRQEAIEAIVGALEGAGGERLAASEGLAATQQALGGADVFEYVNVAALIEKSRREAVGNGWGEDFEHNWGHIEAITGLGPATLRGVGIGVSLGPNGVTTTVRLSAPGAAGGFFGGFAREAPALKSVSYVPQGAAGYMAFSLGSLSQVYADIVACFKAYDKAEDIGALESFEEGLGQLEEVLGMDLNEKLLPAFGGEVAFVSWMPKGLAVPPAAALIEVKDADVARELVGRILKLAEENTAGQVKATTAQVGGVEVTTVEGVPQVTPAIAFVGDFLIVATEPGVIEQIAGVKAGQPSLESAPGYQRYVASLPGQGTVTMYVDIQQVLGFVVPLAEQWIGLAGGAQGSTSAVFELLRALAKEPAAFGLKIMGDKDGITVRSSSPYGALAETGFLAGVVLFQARTGAVMMVPEEAEFGVGPMGEDEEFVPEEGAGDEGE